MSAIDESQLGRMKSAELFRLRRQCAENLDLESLLIIAKYRFEKGSIATIESSFPEICYYYGRLHRVDELQNFLKEKGTFLNMVPESCKELSQNLLNIGYKFPYLNEREILYLEDRYCDSKTFELFDILMFDSDLLPRLIKKFDKERLNKINENFTREFTLQIYDCFSKNEEMNGGYGDLYVYDRMDNKIIRKKYENLGLGEYCILAPILSNEFWSLMKEQYSGECADYFAQQLSFDSDWEGFKNSDLYLLNTRGIDKVAEKYFSDFPKVNDVKAYVALFWLKKINSMKINLV